MAFRALLGAALVSFLALAGCSDDGGGEDFEADAHVVTIQGNRFTPASVPARQGDTIVFENNDGVAHTATLDSGERDTGNIGPGKEGRFTVPTPGTLRYHCKIHPGMSGTIIVAAD